MIKKILGGLTIIVLIAIFVYKDLYTRVTVIGTLFSGQEQYENLNRFYKFIDSSTLSPSPNPLNFESSKAISYQRALILIMQKLRLKTFFNKQTLALC